MAEHTLVMLSSNTDTVDTFYAATTLRWILKLIIFINTNYYNRDADWISVFGLVSSYSSYSFYLNYSIKFIVTALVVNKLCTFAGPEYTNITGFNRAKHPRLVFPCLLQSLSGQSCFVPLSKRHLACNNSRVVGIMIRVVLSKQKRSQGFAT